MRGTIRIHINREPSSSQIIGFYQIHPIDMLFRALLALCLVSSIGAVTLAICQNYCASVNGGASYDNCSPWISFATQTNQTCYNLCVHNCAAVYDGSCMTGNNFRCCLATTPAKTQEFKVSGCNTLYNNL
ncbi:hypothetical protein GCK72_025285 [Caenorhabditis remanei]|uniref:Nematode Specific Peptide family, group C n=2 Tax=Caenorhabditis remanei TaxID=31234 RepID=A0A6A5G1K6_CAERE|nr:hypothetical protein GCK72_025285 [Caenorhabditis remanei]KAF1748818.1 hypothetical protein GCK72_025285 [Caenorhabditis remanei]